MITDEQLIERIRTALNDEVAGLHPPANLLERLRSARAPRRQPAFRVGGMLGLCASIAVVVAVVVLLSPLGHRRSSPTGVSSVPAGTPAGARGLVAQVALLRRPQIAADRLPASIIAQAANSGGDLLIIPKLTRLATTVDVGPGPLRAVQIYVVVGKPRGYPADIVTALAIGGRPRHRHLLYPANIVDTETAAATGGLTPRAVASNGNLTLKEWLNIGVVPDGVTRVKWVFSRRVTVYPRVENNVAVPRAGRLDGLLSANWYGSDGRVTESYAVTSVPSVRRVLEGDGIGSVAFGQPRSTVVPELERLLGPPHETIPGICGFGRSTDWIGLSINSHDVPSAELNLNFKGSRFVGYAYSANGEGPGRRRHGVLLATTRGLALGDTVARARDLYGGAFIQTSVPQGTPPSAKLPRLPVGEVSTAKGKISAGIQGSGRTDRVDARSTVASIAAGTGPNTPCR